LEPGDICLVNTGATIGKMAVAKNNDLTPKTTFQKSVAIIKLMRNFVLIEYLEIFLLGSVQQLAKTSGGSAINNLLLSDLKHLLFPLPPIMEQQRIAEKVHRLSNLISQLKQQAQQDQEQASYLFHLVLKETFQVASIVQE
jgi:type I restriction enzyme, S subunit